MHSKLNPKLDRSTRQRWNAVDSAAPRSKKSSRSAARFIPSSGAAAFRFAPSCCTYPTVPADSTRQAYEGTAAGMVIRAFADYTFKVRMRLLVHVLYPPFMTSLQGDRQ
jgi:hypothetical protein